MSATYTLPDEETLQLLQSVMEQHHRPLFDAGVRVAVLFASELKAHGYSALGTIRVIPLKGRIMTNFDAELLIDRPEWERMKPRHRAALIDHELSHLKLRKHHYRTPEGKPPEIVFDTDDIGRPKLGTVKGDWNCGDGFKAVVRRHGDFAVEFLNLQRCHAYARAAKEGREPPEGSEAA